MKLPNINTAIANTYQSQQRLTGLFVSVGSMLAIVLELGLVVAGFTVVGSHVTPALWALWGCIGFLFALLVTKLTLTNATKLRISLDNEKVLRACHKERGKELGIIPVDVQSELNKDIKECKSGRAAIYSLIGIGALMSITCETFVMELLFTTMRPAVIGDALSFLLSSLVTCTVVSGELHKERDADIIRKALSHDSFLELAAKATVYDAFNRNLIREASTHVKEVLDHDVMGEYAKRLVFTSTEESTGTQNFALQIEQSKTKRLQENRLLEDSKVRMLKQLRGEEDIDTEPTPLIRGINEGEIEGITARVEEPVSINQGEIEGINEGIVCRRYTSDFASQIEELYRGNPDVTPSQISKIVGCNYGTAKKWLARVKPAE